MASYDSGSGDELLDVHPDHLHHVRDVVSVGDPESNDNRVTIRKSGPSYVNVDGDEICYFTHEIPTNSGYHIDVFVTHSGVRGVNSIRTRRSLAYTSKVISALIQEGVKADLNGDNVNWLS